MQLAQLVTSPVLPAFSQHARKKEDEWVFSLNLGQGTSHVSDMQIICFDSGFHS